MEEHEIYVRYGKYESKWHEWRDRLSRIEALLPEEVIKRDLKRDYEITSELARVSAKTPVTEQVQLVERFNKLRGEPDGGFSGLGVILNFSEDAYVQYYTKNPTSREDVLRNEMPSRRLSAGFISRMLDVGNFSVRGYLNRQTADAPLYDFLGCINKEDVPDELKLKAALALPSNASCLTVEETERLGLVDFVKENLDIRDMHQRFITPEVIAKKLYQKLGSSPSMISLTDTEREIQHSIIRNHADRSAAIRQLQLGLAAYVKAYGVEKQRWSKAVWLAMSADDPSLCAQGVYRGYLCLVDVPDRLITEDMAHAHTSSCPSPACLLRIPKEMLTERVVHNALRDALRSTLGPIIDHLLSSAPAQVVSCLVSRFPGCGLSDMLNSTSDFRVPFALRCSREELAPSGDDDCALAVALLRGAAKHAFPACALLVLRLGLEDAAHDVLVSRHAELGEFAGLFSGMPDMAALSECGFSL